MRAMFVFAWLCLGTSLFAAEQAGLSTSGPIAPAKLVALAADGSLTLEAGGKKSTYPPGNLVSFGKFTESDRGPLVVLADGSWVVADLTALSADEYRIDSRLLGELSLPRGSVRGIIFRLPAEKPARDRLIDRLLTRKDPHDLLVLANGDELAGQTSQHKIDADTGDESLQFVAQGGKEPISLPVPKIAALAFDPVLIDAAVPQGAHFLMGLRDGSRLVVTSVALSAGRYELTLASGLKLRLDKDALESDVVAWQPMGHGVVYLSDLLTSGYKHIPFLSTPWPFENDRQDLGGRLRASGAMYVKGIGMHSTARLAYELPEGYRQFQAEIALDDAAGDRGSVIFRVFTNAGDATWKTAYESPIVRGGEAPRSIHADLVGVKRIALIVDFAERGDEQDHAVWLNARLVK